MKVLLIQPKHIGTKYLRLKGNEIPIGLAYTAAFLENNNIDVEILDLNLHDDNIKILKAKLNKYNPKFVGLTANTVDIISAADIAKLCKEFDKNIVTIIGGPHASALPERTLEEFPSFDYAVYGEGEQTFLEILKKGKKADGIAFRENKRIKKNKTRAFIKDLDCIPFPARHKLELKKYIPLPGNYLKLPSTAILTARGCVYNCAFCNKSVFSNIMRFRSPENIVKEIEECVKRYGIYDFRFNDDTLTFDNKRLKGLCNLIIKKRLNVSWNCYSRVEHVDLDLLKLMKKAGCYHIKYGIESGSRRVLKLLKKEISFKQAEDAIRLTRKAGIESKAMFMIGIPGETKEEIKKTIRFARKLNPDIASFLIYTPLPGSQLYEEVKSKIKDISWDRFLQQDDSVLNLEISAGEIKKLYKKAYTSFYFRPMYFYTQIKRLFTSPRRTVQICFNGFRIMHPLFTKKF